MKEYIEAKKELDRVYAEAKKTLAEKVQPVFFQTFKEFFEKNPAVAEFSFELSSSIYDDENYSCGVESVKFLLLPEHINEDNEDQFRWGFEDAAWNMEKSPEDYASVGCPKTVKRLAQDIEQFGEYIQNLDYDFLETVFKPDCTIQVNKEGFKIR